MLTPAFSAMTYLRTLAISLAATLACGSALGQWQWIDETGSKVFSDTAPPQNIPEKNILKRPGAGSVRAAPAQEAPKLAAPAEVKPAGVDPKLEAKKKEAEKAEALRRQQEAEKVAKARAESCERAKRARATLQLGTRVQTVNAQGERTFMDDAARASEIKRLDAIAASDCGAPSGKTAVP